jgi:hypothetical protein
MVFRTTGAPQKWVTPWLAIAEKMAFAETCHTKCTQENGLAVSVTDEKTMVE